MKRKDFESYTDRYCDYLLLRNKSERTIQEYHYDLSLFIDYLEENNLLLPIENINNVNNRHIEKFIIYLRTKRRTSQDKKLSPRTINRKLYALRSFFKFLIRKKLYNKENPAESVDEIQTTTTNAHTYLSEKQAVKLLQETKKRKYFPRDSLMLKFMLLLGLRVSEVSNIDIGDINLSNQTITVKGKGDKERALPLPAELNNSIKNYLIFRSETYNCESKKALFISRNGNRISTRMIQIIVKELANALGLNEATEDESYRRNITPHKLRHTFATLAAQRGVDVLTLKTLLGHESIATTQIYTEAADQQLKDAVQDNPILKL